MCSRVAAANFHPWVALLSPSDQELAISRINFGMRPNFSTGRVRCIEKPAEA